jgi:predicted ATPase/DNA-binding SARP family transcriptional activator
MMSETRLFLLGSPHLERDGSTLKVGRRKALALLAYLAVTGQAHRRETLTTLLWPDAEPSRALSYLRRDLAVLNKVLKPACLDADRENVGLVLPSDSRAALWLDIAHFRGLVRDCAGHGHPQDEVCPHCMPLLSEAVDLYRGDFMAGFSLRDSPNYDDWQLFEQEALRHEVTRALGQLVRGHSIRGEFELAMSYARRWLQLDPWHEPAHRQLMLLQAWNGDRASALRQYTACVRVLQTELGSPPEDATSALNEAIQAGRTPPPPAWAEEPPPRSVARRSNPLRALPPETTPFVNREGELAAIKRLLLDEPSCRLLTLVGPGGIGKTRLALKTAMQVVDAYPDGVHLVLLASTPGEDLLVASIADALMVSFQGRTEPKTQLLNYLREKELLLVLDNMEHLLGGRDLISEILLHAPGVRILVTSRIRLSLHAEWVWVVEGLSYPGAETSPASMPATLAKQEPENGVLVQRYSAVRLFLESVHRNCPSYHLTDADQAAITRICQLLEGMPLGLELASAWARIMPLAEIAREIERNIDFLATSMQDLPARHRNLRALFEHSWQLLSKTERTAIAKLSVFRGGFERQAADRVASVSPFLLAALVDKSVLRPQSGPHPSGRYDMHELLRQFAADKLREMGAEQEARETHGSYYSSFLQQQESRLRGAEQQDAADEIAAEIDNVRAAWRWSTEQCRATEIAQSLESLHLFYYARGWVQEGQEAFQRALACMEAGASRLADEDGWISGRLMARLARFSHRLGRHPEAHDLLQKALALYDRFPDRPEARGEVAFALFSMSVVLRGDGQYEEAQRLCQESLEIYQGIDDHPGVAMALKHLGIIQGALGQFEQAQQRLHGALRLYQDSGDSYGTANTLNDLGIVAAGMDQYVPAKRYYQECLAIRREIEDLWGIGTALNNLGYLAYLDGEYAEAKGFLTESLAIQLEIGDRYHIANCLNNLGAAACALGEYDEAADHLYEALRSAHQIDANPLVLEILAEIGALWVASAPQDRERAIELLAFVLHHPLTDRWTADRAKRRLAQLAPDLDTLAAAQERGKQGDLDAIVAEVPQINSHTAACTSSTPPR